MRKKYTVTEIAEMINVEEARIHRDIQRGRLRGVKAGRDWLFTFKDLEIYFGPDKTKELVNEGILKNK